jgi:cobalt-zinc-cadmium efflux system protein
MMADVGHGHHHHGHLHGFDRVRGVRALGLVLALTAAFAAVEIVAGLLSGSLALVADAGHMASDALSAGIALLAVALARRPATLQRSYGYQRAEILAALANGAGLVAVAVWVAVEAVQRLRAPEDVAGGWVLLVAVIGLLVNVGAATALLRAGRESLNIEAAFRHVIADALGSVGVIVAAVVIIATGWDRIDPILSLLIAALILGSAWGVLRDSLGVLLEHAPRGLDVSAVEQAIVGVPGVRSLHDLHVWTITSGFVALSAHVLVAGGEDCHARRRDVERVLGETFGITHTTLQVDHEADQLLQIRSEPR